MEKQKTIRLFRGVCFFKLAVTFPSSSIPHCLHLIPRARSEPENDVGTVHEFSSMSFDPCSHSHVAPSHHQSSPL